MADTVNVVSFISKAIVLSHLIVVIAQGPLSVTVDVQSSNPAERGSRVILACNYTRSSSLTLDSLGWSKGGTFTGSLVIAIYNTRYDEIDYNDTYGHSGDYVMTVPDTESLIGTSTLTISSVHPTDIGSYWCHINAEGYIEKDFVTLEVIDAKGEYYVTEGSNVTISCVLPNAATSSTLIYYAWRKFINPDTTIPIIYWDTEVLTPTNTHEFPFPDYQMTFDKATLSSNLTIASVGVEHDGMYLCTTSFVPTPIGGNPEEQFSLYVLGNSENITATTAFTTMLTSSYRAIQTSATSGTMTSEMINFLDIIRVESKLIELSWSLFHERNDDIEKYRVFYNEGEKGDSIIELVNVEGHQDSVNISNLSPDETYVIHVEANTNRGELLIVGSLEVTTSVSVNNVGCRKSLIITSSVTVPVVVVLALIFIVIYRRFRNSRQLKSEGMKATPEPEYEIQAIDTSTYQDLDLAIMDNSAYQDLQLATDNSAYQDLDLATGNSVYQDLQSATDNSDQDLQSATNNSAYQDLQLATDNSTYQELDLATDNSAYQDLHLATREDPHMYQATATSTLASSSRVQQCTEYVVPDLAQESQPPTIPEYIEFYETHPEVKLDILDNNPTQSLSQNVITKYMELDPKTRVLDQNDHTYQSLNDNGSFKCMP
ncbi:uncharacterized protein [Amphiura filiformis]|uniref:uncharacterized protein isoform X2 n=1 Tax=Amphiura filiformis TaxID=82378 RepID=UPI003B220B9C